MMLARAEELKNQVTEALKSQQRERCYSEIYIDLGKDYLRAMKEIENIFKSVKITWAEGRIGQRLTSLKMWLMTTSEGEKI